MVLRLGLALRAPVALAFSMLVAAAGPAAAQEISIALGDGSLAGQSLFLIALLTVLSLVPGIAVMVTCFPFIVTVLSILRQAIGLQQAPPNMLIISLSLFLTWFIMEPVLTEAWSRGAAPLIEGTLAVDAAFREAAAPFRLFMAARTDPETLATLAALRPDAASADAGPAVPLSLLVPSFLLSEITRAFEIGFMLFLPFLIIDLVVSAVLMAMGMMMVPPAVVALPFKLAFFVIADGWTLVAEALVRSYA